MSFHYTYFSFFSFSISAIFSFNILISSSDKFFISLIWLIRSEFNSFSFSMIFSCRLCFNSSFKVFPCSTVRAPLSINSSINFLDFSLVLAIAPTPNKNAFSNHHLNCSFYPPCIKIQLLRHIFIIYKSI